MKHVCQHVEKDACVECVTGRHPITRNKNFSKLFNSVSLIKIGKNISREFSEVLAATFKPETLNG